MKALGLLTVLLMGIQGALASDFYVAPGGSDTNPGTKILPFATLARARDAVALTRRAGRSEPNTVWIASGRYVTREGITFNAGDSGTATSPTVYRAIAGAEVILSNGMAIPGTALSAVQDPKLLARLRPVAKDHVMQVHLDALGIKATSFKDTFRKFDTLEVYFNGSRLPLARWPNGNTFTTISKVIDNGVNPAHGGTFAYRGEEPASWTQAVEDEGVWLRGFWRVPWVIEAAKISAIDPVKKTITFATPINLGIGSKYARDKTGVGPGDGKEPWQAINLLEEIDQPGEWCVNFKTNILYFWPPGDLKNGSLLVSDRKQPVISVNGAAHLNFEGLTIEGGLGCGFAVTGGHHVSLTGCRVRGVGDCGVLILGGHDHMVQSCDIYDVGQEGISFTGGDRRTLAPGNHKIINNEIYRVGVNYPAAAITAGDKTKSETVGNLVAHNRIHDVPNCGIVFAGNDNVFELNEIYRVGLGSSDLGCFYTTGGWTSRGNIIRHNFVHHSMNANGFYVDDGDSGDSFSGNVDFMTASGGFVGGGHDHSFTNNIFVECVRAFHVDSRGVSRHYNDQDKRLMDDLHSVPYQAPPWSEKYPNLVHILENRPDIPSGILISGNLMVSCGEAIRRSGKPEELSGVSFDANLESADASLFEDPLAFNFALKTGAKVPASLAGLKTIPFKEIGLCLDQYRTTLPERDMALLRTGNTTRQFDSQTDVDASNR